VAGLLREDDHVGLGPDFPVGLVFVPEADVPIIKEVLVAGESCELLGEDVVLIGDLREGVRPRQRRFNVGVPEGPDQFAEGVAFPGLDALVGLPDDVADQAGDVNGEFRGALPEGVLQPVRRLVVDVLFVGADPQVMKLPDGVATDVNPHRTNLRD